MSTTGGDASATYNGITIEGTQSKRYPYGDKWREVELVVPDPKKVKVSTDRTSYEVPAKEYTQCVNGVMKKVKKAARWVKFRKVKRWVGKKPPKPKKRKRSAYKTVLMPVKIPRKSQPGVCVTPIPGYIPPDPPHFGAPLPALAPPSITVSMPAAMPRPVTPPPQRPLTSNDAILDDLNLLEYKRRVDRVVAAATSSQPPPPPPPPAVVAMDVPAPNPEMAVEMDDLIDAFGTESGPQPPPTPPPEGEAEQPKRTQIGTIGHVLDYDPSKVEPRKDYYVGIPAGGPLKAPLEPWADPRVAIVGSAGMPIELEDPVPMKVSKTLYQLAEEESKGLQAEEDTVNMLKQQLRKEREIEEALKDLERWEKKELQRLAREMRDHAQAVAEQTGATKNSLPETKFIKKVIKPLLKREDPPPLTEEEERLRPLLVGDDDYPYDVDPETGERIMEREVGPVRGKKKGKKKGKTPFKRPPDAKQRKTEAYIRAAFFSFTPEGVLQ